MGFILGFGSTEEAVRAEVKFALISGLKEGKTIDQVLSVWNDKAKQYDKMPRGEAPERYTTIHYYEDALHFTHINRNHPFSPDGWAAWSVDEPLLVVKEATNANH